MSRRDRVLQILVDAGGPLAEAVILSACHRAGDLSINENSLRMILRGLGDRARCVKNGPRGSAWWEAGK